MRPPGRADGRAERVVEVRCALGGRDRVAASDVRLVHELLVAALDEGEAVPKEGFGFGQGRGTAVGTECRPYRRGGELPVGVVGESALRVAIGYREDLVEVDWKQSKQLRGQLERGRLATASRFPPRKLARRPSPVVFHVVHVVFSSRIQARLLVGA